MSRAWVCSVFVSVYVYTQSPFCRATGRAVSGTFCSCELFETAISQEWKLHAAMYVEALNFTEIPVPAGNNLDSFPAVQVAWAL